MIIIRSVYERSTSVVCTLHIEIGGAGDVGRQQRFWIRYHFKAVVRLYIMMFIHTTCTQVPLETTIRWVALQVAVLRAL